jgi:hypothetical protein
MEQATTITETPITQAPIPSIVPEVAAPVAPPVVNLIDKVSQFKKTQASTKAPSTNTENSFFDYKEIEKITDPVAKKFAEDAYKSMQSGFTKKTQEIAEYKRSYEQKMAEIDNWSPERIQRELNNPKFVQAAQAVAGNQNDPSITDEYSAMTPQEKARIDALMSKVTTLEQSNFQATVAQRDSQLQTRYPDYNPVQIDATIRDLAQMNPLDIREHVYKSLKHDEDVAAAYELGRSEAKELNQTKVNAITPNGNYASTSDGLPAREKGDNDQAYFQKLANFRLSQFKNRK